MAKHTELIRFKLLRMPCCHTQVCWVNPRLPNHCPECGASVLLLLRAKPEQFIIATDDAAKLVYSK